MTLGFKLGQGSSAYKPECLVLSGEDSMRPVAGLSKPLVHKGQQCSKALWLDRNPPAFPRADDPARVRKIRENLLRYCELDTLGMVRILEALEKNGDCP